MASHGMLCQAMGERTVMLKNNVNVEGNHYHIKK